MRGYFLVDVLFRFGKAMVYNALIVDAGKIEVFEHVGDFFGV